MAAARRALALALLWLCLGGAAARAARGGACPVDEEGRECGGHGLCRRGICLCDPGFSGPQCQPAKEKMRRGDRASPDGVTEAGRPRYGREYASQLKENLAKEMDRRKAENAARMAKLRDQFKNQNRDIEQASSSVREKLERAKMENAAHIEEMQEQREVEVEEINRNTERIREQVDGVGEGLKEQLQQEYDEVTQAAQDAADAPLGDEAFEDELEEEPEDLPFSLDLYLSATDDVYEVVPVEVAETAMYEDDQWEQRPRKRKKNPKFDQDAFDSKTREAQLKEEEENAAAALGAPPPNLKRAPPPPPPPARARPPPPVAVGKVAAEESYEVIALDDDDDDFL